MASYRVQQDGSRAENPSWGVALTDFLKPNEAIQGPMKYVGLGLAFLGGNILGFYAGSGQIGVGVAPGLKFPK
jgi:hypothetical protein